MLHDSILNIIQCVNYDHTQLDNTIRPCHYTVLPDMDTHMSNKQAPLFSIEDFTGNFN